MLPKVIKNGNGQDFNTEEINSIKTQGWTSNNLGNRRGGMELLDR